MTPQGEDIRYAVFDPAIWSKKGESDAGLSGAEIMQNRWREINPRRSLTEPARTLNLQKASNDRIIGWGAFREYLKPYHANDNLTAKLQVFSTCTEAIRTIPSLIYDAHKIEDVDSDGEDHAADAIRYGIMSRPTPAMNKDQRADYHFNKHMKEKARKKERPLLYRQ